MTLKQTISIIVLISLFLTVGVFGIIDSPSNKEEVRKTRVIHPHLRPYVEDFLIRMSINGIEIPDPEVIIIDLVDIYENPNIAGIAEGMNKDMVYVRINRAVWRRLNNNDRLLLIYHELAHDVYNLEHGSIDLMKRSIQQIKGHDKNELIKELINKLKNEQN